MGRGMGLCGVLMGRGRHGMGGYGGVTRLSCAASFRFDDSTNEPSRAEPMLIPRNSNVSGDVCACVCEDSPSPPAVARLVSRTKVM